METGLAPCSSVVLLIFNILQYPQFLSNVGGTGSTASGLVVNNQWLITMYKVSQMCNQLLLTCTQSF